MKGSDSDFLQRFKFDVEIESQEEAHRIHNLLSELFQTRLASIMEEVFKEYHPAEVVIRIDQLELDLGEILEHVFEKEFTFRFEKKLRKALWDLVGPPGKRLNPTSKVELIALAPAKIEVFEHFLRTGQSLPRADQRISMERLLQELLDESPQVLLDSIKAVVMTGPVAVQRMVLQFAPSTIHRLYRLAAPSYADYLVTQEQTIAAELAKATKIPEPEMVRAARTEILSYLFGTKTLVFTPKAFRAEMARRFAKRHNEKAADAFRDVPDPTQVRAAEAAVEEDRQEERFAEIIRRFLYTGTASEGNQAVVEAWGQLILNAPARLARIMESTEASVARIVSLLALLPLHAAQTFFQRAVPGSVTALMEIAAATIAVYAAYVPNRAQDQVFIRQVYAALIHHTVLRASSPMAVTPASAVQALARQLKSIPEAPAPLLQALEEESLPGVTGLQPKSKSSSPDAPPKAEEDAKTQEEIATERLKAFEEVEEEERRVAESLLDRPEETAASATTIWGDAESSVQAAEADALYREDAAFTEEQEAKAKEAAAAQGVETVAEEGEVTVPPAIVEGEEASPPLVEGEESQVEVTRPPVDPGAEGAEMDTPPIVPPVTSPQTPADRPADTLPPDAERIEPRDTFPTRDIDLPAVAKSDKVATDFEGSEFDTVEARLDFIAHFIRHGEMPWWVPGRSPFNLEQAVVTVQKVRPAALVELFRRIILQTPTAAYPAMVAHLTQHLSQTALKELAIALLPGIGGFMPTVATVLGKYYDAPPRKVSLPAHLRHPHTFAWHYIIRFVFEYFSSNPGAAALARYVVENTGRDLGDSPRIFLREVNAINEILIAKGETKYAAFKAMLPRPEQELFVEPPVPHPQWSEVEAEAQSPSPETKVSRVPPQTEAGQEKPALKKTGEVPVEPRGDQATPLVQPEAEKDAPTEPNIQSLPAEGVETSPSDAGQPEKVVKDTLLEAEQLLEGEEEVLSTAAPVEVKGAKEFPAAIEGVRPEVLAMFGSVTELVALVKHYLLQGTTPGHLPMAISKAEFAAIFQYVFTEESNAFWAMLRPIVGQKRVRQRLAQRGEAVMYQAILEFAPSIAVAMTPYVRAVATLMEPMDAPVQPPSVLDFGVLYAARTRSAVFSPFDFVRGFLDYVSSELRVEAKGLFAWMGEKLEHSNIPEKFALTQVMGALRSIPRSTPQQEASKKRKPATTTPQKKGTEEIYVTNAGVVLVGAFIPQLFAVLKYLTPDKKSFASEELRARAIHVLQYVVAKEQDAPEEKLTLNKILVAMPIDQPIEHSVVLTQDEMDTVESMLEAVCARFTPMKNTKPLELRARWMMRDGRLKRTQHGWNLKVQQRGFDILLGRLTWGMNPVRFPWLEEKVEVDWR